MSLFSRLKAWYNSQDTQQRINVAVSFVSDGFRVVMASLLSVFVPQSCDGQLCTVQENVSHLIDYNSFVLSFNLFTLAVFILLYIIELHRERWMISHLDYDKNLDEVYLVNHKEKYPKIFSTLQSLNKKYHRAYSTILYIYILNFIFSAVLVYHYYYYEYRSITVLLTNISLCWTKIRQGLKIAKDSKENNLAYSFFNVRNLSFNTIDKRYVIKEKPPVIESSV